MIGISSSQLEGMKGTKLQREMNLHN